MIYVIFLLLFFMLNFGNICFCLAVQESKMELHGSAVYVMFGYWTSINKTIQKCMAIQNFIFKKDRGRYYPDWMLILDRSTKRGLDSREKHYFEVSILR